MERTSIAASRATRNGEMKILLISANVAQVPYPVYPLGLGIIAAALEKAGHAVTQFDLLQNNRSMEAVAAAVREADPDIVGISLRNIDNTNLLHEEQYIPCVREIVATVRRESSCRVVLGGSGFSIMPEVILDTVGADYGIVGEGEKLMVDFVAEAAVGRYPETRCVRAAPGLMGGEMPGAVYDRDIMRFYQKSGNLAGVQTKRGCTHHCVYCSYPVLEGAAIRPRAPRDVVADIRRLIDEHNVGYIFFTDSVFNDEAGHFREVVRQMHREGINVPWTAFFRPSGLDTATVTLMKETGLHAAELGADASNDTALKRLGKCFTFADIARCSDLLVEQGVACAHYYMFGCPGETEALVDEGIANIRSLQGAAVFIFMGIRVLPGTPLAEIARRDGLFSDDKELLESVYYLAPDVDRDWLEQRLTDAFAELDHCVFPPDSMDAKLRFLHSLGHVGPLWDLLLRKRNRRLRSKKK